MGITRDLRSEKVAHLNLSAYSTVPSGTSINDAVAQMRSDRCSCAFIVDPQNRLIGIFTDRDVLHKVVDQPQLWDGSIDQVMTPEPISVRPDATIAEALQLMEEGHFRNVPAVDSNGRVAGNLTHSAIVKFITDHFSQTVYNLPPDPEKFSERRHGG